jgi:hypothetical protein
MPTISSLFTFMPRPIVDPRGGIDKRAANNIFFPISKPALCGPLNALPPEIATQ